MKTHRLYFCSAMFALLAACPPALAQENPNAATQGRIDRLERDIMLLQKQIARGDAPTPLLDAPSSNAENIPIENAAQVEVRLAAMDEQLRAMRGRVEESEFQVKKLGDTLEKLQKDVEFRFNELAAAKPVAAAPAEPAATPPATPAPTLTAPEAPAATPAEPAPAGEFATPKEHYNYAFRLLNQTKYEEAAKAFDDFTKKYPKDPLAGNAHYWQGETYYIRRDYVAAADSFRQGFEALPAGPKAADNLLKLAMSLSALNRDKEACVVLTQLSSKFKKTAPGVVTKADQEHKRIGCR
jgi:tol-pal system protein YbgF